MLEKYGKGMPGRLDRAQPLHRPPNLGIDLAAVRQHRAVRPAGRGDVGAADGAGCRSGPPASINGLGHWWGYRNFDTADTATNLTPWGLLIGGEELHNNHHAFPSSAKFALRKLRVRHRLGGAVDAGEAAPGQGAARGAASWTCARTSACRTPRRCRAMMVHRWQVATDYFATVLKPQLKAEAEALPRRLRRALRSEGRWLDAGAPRAHAGLRGGAPAAGARCSSTAAACWRSTR